MINRIIEEEARTIVQRFPDIPVTIIDNDDQIYHLVSDRQKGKKTLYISHLSGNFVKSCPGTAKSYRCCQYYVINEMTNCPLDCSYCILQFYLELPVITYYINIGQMLSELVSLSRKFPERILRIGTGELTDSLALDSYFSTNSKIIKKVTSLPNIIFEVKTKTTLVDHLLDLAFPRLVFSWSVNPEFIIKSEEHLTSSLNTRLKAMEKIVATPAKIGFHFDPIIYYDNWEEGYQDLIKKLAKSIPAGKIAWISMGTFRHPAELRFSVIKNHPHSILTSQESVTGMDGKTRYPKYQRKVMYRTIYNLLRNHFGEEVFIYFCMESPEIWNAVMGKAPASNEELDWWFACSLQRRFPDMNFPPPQIEDYPSDW